ncbi:MAG: carboxypeptidase regulatory-like domain-containing protein [Bacteroidetes bacterium]|nr:MAG: carboxypeptidase regulatory-like domain-containing protein [Bacteroidota bacterium]TAF92018.1 MAG: carboxypeptidase regulatory-like domain-containing protein [Bacteroidota bacterium]
MIMKIWATSVLIALTTIVFGQLDTEKHFAELKNPIPPSPNASSLGKFGEYPVGLYTGVPSIQIPIYDIELHGTKLPISLSYHASGIKVGEVASWVGLGWTLQGGGAISRAIRGQADESIQTGYLHHRQTNYINPTNVSVGIVNQTTLSYNQFLIDAANGEIDTEPDSYSFNAFGESFSFFFGNNGQIISNPANSIKITTNFLSNSLSSEFYVTLENGIKLVFGGQNFVEYTRNTRRSGTPTYISSWMLKKVTLLNGSEINLSYNSVNTLQDSYSAESDYIVYKLDANHCGERATPTSSKKVVEILEITTLQLATIETENEVVSFVANTVAREDFKNCYSLKEVIVTDKRLGIQICRFLFNYEYSTASYSNVYLNRIAPEDLSYYSKRLKLKKLIKVSNSGDANKQEWSFEYNPVTLPSRRSYAQDYWGYFNGAVNNNSLLPNVYYQVPPNNPYSENVRTTTGFMPENHPHENVKDAVESFMKAETLVKIIYPTGGFTNFNYEANRLNVTKERFTTDNKTLQFNLSTSNNPFINTYDVAFTVTKPQYIYLSLNGNISQSILDERINSSISGSVINSNGNVVASVILFNQQGGSSTRWYNLLEAGNYTLRLSTNLSQNDFVTGFDQASAHLFLKYEKSDGVSSFQELVGGLRVSSIEDFDVITMQKVMEKKYTYEQPLLLSTVNDPNNFLSTSTLSSERVVGTYPETPSTITCMFQKVTRNSSTNYSFGTTRGGIVGYGKVTVEGGVNGSNGREVNYFSNEPDVVNTYFPFPPNVSKENRRGLLLKQEYYTSGNVLTKKIENIYQFNYAQFLNTIKAGFKNQLTSNQCAQQPPEICNVVSAFYETLSERINKTETTETSFDNLGNSQVNTTRYYYDNPVNKNPTRTTTLDSKGHIVTNISYTPLDKSLILARTPLAPYASQAIDELVSKNQINVPIFKETSRNSHLVSQSLVNYWTSNVGLTLPSSVASKIGNEPLETKVLFNGYDSKGNILEQQKSNDVPECFIWGYNQQYPVAKIIGATWSQANAVFRTEDLAEIAHPSSDESLRNVLQKLRLQLPQAVVNTYTYRPLIGISSQTDANNKTTYYFYDAFNRLSLVKDRNGNVLKRICYNYQGQPEVCYSQPATVVVPPPPPTTIYVRLRIEDPIYYWDATYANIVVYFYADANGTVPLTVNNLAIDYQIVDCSGFANNLNATADGVTSLVLQTGTPISNNHYYNWTTGHYDMCEYMITLLGSANYSIIP